MAYPFFMYIYCKNKCPSANGLFFLKHIGSVSMNNFSYADGLAVLACSLTILICFSRFVKILLLIVKFCKTPPEQNVYVNARDFFKPSLSCL